MCTANQHLALQTNTLHLARVIAQRSRQQSARCDARPSGTMSPTVQKSTGASCKTMPPASRLLYNVEHIACCTTPVVLQHIAVCSGRHLLCPICTNVLLNSWKQLGAVQPRSVHADWSGATTGIACSSRSLAHRAKGDAYSLRRACCTRVSAKNPALSMKPASGCNRAHRIPTLPLQCCPR